MDTRRGKRSKALLSAKQYLEGHPTALYDDIAAHLNAMGHKTGAGNPYTRNAVSGLLLSGGIRQNAPYTQKKTKAKESGATDICVEVQMVLEMQVNDNRKLALIRVLVEEK